MPVEELARLRIQHIQSVPTRCTTATLDATTNIPTLRCSVRLLRIIRRWRGRIGVLEGMLARLDVRDGSSVVVSRLDHVPEQRENDDAGGDDGRVVHGVLRHREESRDREDYADEERPHDADDVCSPANDCKTMCERRPRKQ